MLGSIDFDTMRRLLGKFECESGQAEDSSLLIHALALKFPQRTFRARGAADCGGNRKCPC